MSNVSQRRAPTRALVVLGVSALTSLLAVPAFAGQVNLSGLDSQPTLDRFIVKYKDGSSAAVSPTSMRASLNSVAGAMPARAGRALGLNHVRRTALGSEVLKTDRGLDRADAETLMRRIAADPSVDYVEVDQIMYPVLTPNDTRLSEQWGFGTSSSSINVRPAWDTATGTGVVVAVIDTGITSHPDLNANVLPGYDFISDATRARDNNGRDSNPADQGDWTRPTSASPVRRPPIPVGTAPTSPAPSRRSPTTAPAWPAPHSTPASCRSVRWVPAAAPPPTSSMRSCGPRAAPCPACRPMPTRPK